MDKILTEERVTQIFKDSIFRDGESQRDYVEAEGVTGTVGFHPGRLKSHKTQIEAMLDELPESFKMVDLGGDSFLNAGMNKHGDVWTSSQMVIEQLLQLGMAVGKVVCTAPMWMWQHMYGGKPYYIVN